MTEITTNNSMREKADRDGFLVVIVNTSADETIAFLAAYSNEIQLMLISHHFNGSWLASRKSDPVPWGISRDAGTD
jgi:hypothetical protein